MAKPSPPNNTNEQEEEDYSPSATLIHFPHPLPLLRQPIPAGPTDDPSLGPYILAFPSPQSFFSSLNFCQFKLLQHCEAGVRIGCSITASNKCRPPWWATLLGKVDFRERSACEEREMAACLANSKEKCESFAKEKCLGPFGWARVGRNEKRLRNKEVGRLISWVSGLGSGLGFMKGKNELGVVSSELSLSYEVTNFRGFELLGDKKI